MKRSFEEEIRALGVSDTEQQHKFQLRNEGEVGAFLGIQITKTGKQTFSLLQTGLVAKVLNVAHMSDCNGVRRQREILQLGVTQMEHHSLKHGNMGL